MPHQITWVLIDRRLKRKKLENHSLVMRCNRTEAKWKLITKSKLYKNLQGLTCKWWLTKKLIDSSISMSLSIAVKSTHKCKMREKNVCIKLSNSKEEIPTKLTLMSLTLTSAKVKTQFSTKVLLTSILQLEERDHWIKI